jgi:hypothetical protein
MTTLSDGTITITEGNIVFSDGSVLDSIENIALLNADNVMTGTNTLTGDVITYHVVESLHRRGTGGPEALV